MKMIILTPGFKASRSLTNFVGDNVGKLALLSDRILEGLINLKLDKSVKKENKICDIKLVMPGSDLFASRYSHTFEDAVLQTIEAIKHQLERWKASNTRS